MLNYHKKKKITWLEHDDGRAMTDGEARVYLHNLQCEGHKLMPTTDRCEGFDPFEKGCPGHPVDEQ